MYSKVEKRGVRDNCCYRLDPVGAASSDSLSGASNSSRQGDGSTEKLSTGSKAKVHPMDKDKGFYIQTVLVLLFWAEAFVLALA